MLKMIVKKNDVNFNWFVDDERTMRKEAVKQGYEVMSVSKATVADLKELMTIASKPEPIKPVYQYRGLK